MKIIWDENNIDDMNIKEDLDSYIKKYKEINNYTDAINMLISNYDMFDSMMA